MILLLSAGYRPAAAANIVFNGGFETGDFTGWTLTDNQNGHTDVNGIMTHTGSYAVEFGNQDYDATLAQTLTDVFGENYTFSFWLTTDGETPADFSALFDTTFLLIPISAIPLSALAATRFRSKG